MKLDPRTGKMIPDDFDYGDTSPMVKSPAPMVTPQHGKAVSDFINPPAKPQQDYLGEALKMINGLRPEYLNTAIPEPTIQAPGTFVEPKQNEFASLLEGAAPMLAATGDPFNKLIAAAGTTAKTTHEEKVRKALSAFAQSESNKRFANEEAIRLYADHIRKADLDREAKKDVMSANIGLLEHMDANQKFNMTQDREDARAKMAHNTSIEVANIGAGSREKIAGDKRETAIDPADKPEIARLMQRRDLLEGIALRGEHASVKRHGHSNDKDAIAEYRDVIYDLDRYKEKYPNIEFKTATDPQEQDFINSWKKK